MNAITYYIASIKNETIKLKRTFAIWLAVISAMFIPLIFFLYYILKYETLIPKEGINPWGRFIQDQIFAAGPLIPLFTVLITSLIIQLEHKSSAIKHLFAMPVPKWSVYFGKLSIVIGMIIFTYTIFFILILLNGVIQGAIHGELNFLAFSPDYTKFLKLLFRSCIAILGIVGIQYWLSFRIKNFIIPLGIGMVLVMTGMIIYRAEESLYFPYAYNMLSLFPIDKDIETLLWFPTVSFYSLGFFTLFSILGYLDIKRMNIK